MQLDERVGICCYIYTPRPLPLGAHNAELYAARIFRQALILLITAPPLFRYEILSRREPQASPMMTTEAMPLSLTPDTTSRQR